MNLRDCARLALKGIALAALLGVAPAAQAQQARDYRIGVLLHGGIYTSSLDGVRRGLKEQGLEEAKHYRLHIRDTKGELTSVAAAARSLEAEGVDLIFSMATSVTLEAKRATASIPIVFYAGTDPVAMGLIDSFRRPGGRLTGVYGRFTDLTGKRLEILKLMVPTLQRVVTFYNPANPNAITATRQTHEAARKLKLEVIEHRVGTVQELRAALNAYQPGKSDAFCYLSDAMVISQTESIIEAARAKKMPTIFADRTAAEAGGLASYGQSYYELGRLSAQSIVKVLRGAKPAEIPVEQLDRLYFVINLKVAKELGLVIPQSVLARADDIIQ